nr:MAG TPA: hypothetical protein [Caudoviricetes sp.]
MIHKGHSRCHKVVSLFLCPVVIYANPLPPL